MIKHKNQIKHDPPHSYGDCHRACVATILGVDPQTVPHFFDEGRGADEGDAILDAYLARFGLRQATILYDGNTDLDYILEILHKMMPGVPVIFGGKSSLGCGHSVVVLDGEIYNDPTENGIVGPLAGFYWVTIFAACPNFATRRGS